jgi:hypothetical protein
LYGALLVHDSLTMQGALGGHDSITSTVLSLSRLVLDDRCSLAARLAHLPRNSPTNRLDHVERCSPRP